MRSIDLTKRADEKAAKTISFETSVLKALETKASDNGTTVSKLVNLACRRMVLNEAQFLDAMALFHEQERAKYQFLKDNLKDTMITKVLVNSRL